MIAFFVVACNLRFFQRALPVARGVYRRPPAKAPRLNATFDELFENAAPDGAPSPRHCRFLRDTTLKAVPASCGGVSRDVGWRRLRLPLLVTSLGGAGSWHASLRLRDAGMRVEHERLGRDGSVCWLYAVRDSTQRPYFRGADLPLMNRGDAAAGDVDMP